MLYKKLFITLFAISVLVFITSLPISFSDVTVSAADFSQADLAAALANGETYTVVMYEGDSFGYQPADIMAGCNCDGFGSNPTNYADYSTVSFGASSLSTDYESDWSDIPSCNPTQAVVQSVTPASPVTLNANEQFTITSTVTDNCNNPFTSGTVYYKIVSSTADCAAQTYAEQLSHAGGGVWQKTATAPSSSGTYKVCVKAV